MTDALAVISPKDLAETRTLAKELAPSQLLPQALKNKPADIAAIVIAGSELGLAPMQAIRGMHIISGKLAMSADLMAGLVRKRRDVCEYLQLVESTDKVALFETKRHGDPRPTRLGFTIEQAERAGLMSNANWKKYPDAMLRARALAAICRAVYPDLCLGIYDPDEIAQPLPAETAAEQQAQHVAAVKDELRAQVKAPTSFGDDFTDAEFEAVPASDPVADLAQEMRTAPTLQALEAAARKVKGTVPSARRSEFVQIYRERMAALQVKP